MTAMPRRERRYTNRVDRKRYGIPKTPLEVFLSETVQASISRTCADDECREDIWNNTPLCEKHAWDMWAMMNEKLVRKEAQQEAEEAAQRRSEHNAARDQMFHDRYKETMVKFQPKPLASTPGLIYYLKVGELVKIGFSSNLDNRLKSYPPDSKLLAQHPGTIKTEQQIHHKFFNHLEHGREWFTPSPELDAHIKDVHQQFPKHNENLIQ